MKKFVAVIVIATMTQVGCGTTGGEMHGEASRVSPVNSATVASFQPGVTTLAQVEAALGAPAKSTRMSNGNVVILYARVRIEDTGDLTPETGSALPKRHKVQHSTLLAFDQQGRLLTSWTRVDDLGDASPSALGKFNRGDILTNASGIP